QVYKEKKKNSGSSSADNVDVEYYVGAGDARMYANIPLIETSDGKARYIVKNSPMSNVSGVEGQAFGNPNFKFYRSIYRLTQVYLRYAEAINRAGYPRLAFTILRDGIDFEKMPTIADSVRYDDVNKTKQTVFYLDSAIVENATNYVGVDELRRAQADPRYEEFLDFSSNMWSNSGIHELGCGTSIIADSIFSYDRVVPERISNEAALYAALGLSVTDTPEPAFHKVAREGETTDDSETEPDRSDYTEIDPVAPAAANQAEIDAVESLIADEMALELAYEGTRMFDLIRIARHKNVANPGFGTAWLAWKIARRDMPYAPFEEVTQMNSTLYSTLLNPENWYVASPVY
ncbi:MAG: RagB/SusD family nutrient uptake outer membrane protein, partial [Alloprevotella sp.]|nr:RagB/SusD family nutrient uptake outer membrane protein [Alloprevotella sp.]